jgi:hypothetical protein
MKPLICLALIKSHVSISHLISIHFKIFDSIDKVFSNLIGKGFFKEIENQTLPGLENGNTVEFRLSKRSNWSKEVWLLKQEIDLSTNVKL